MDSKLFGLTSEDVRHMAYQLAKKLKIPNKFNKELELAGEDWLRSFMSRWKLSLRTPESTSGARGRGFNKKSVAEFFKLASSVMQEYKFPATHIWNCDETGITVNPKKNQKVLSRRGKKQVGAMTSCERGELVSAEICFSASGIYMPPMLVFPRKKRDLSYEIGAPPGAWAEFHPSGWMQTEIFVNWMKKFIEFTHASKENPVLLILDGHSTHANIR